MVQAIENNEIINAKAMLQSAFKELQQENYNLTYALQAKSI